MSRYSSKVVYFYLLSYVQADWEKYTDEIKEFHGEVQNFTASCTGIVFVLADTKCGTRFSNKITSWIVVLSCNALQLRYLQWQF